MDLIRGYFYASTRQELVLGLVGLEAFFTFPFIICSFVVASTANAGFNCVLTGLLNVALAGGSYYVVKNSKAPIAVCSLAAMLHVSSTSVICFWKRSLCECFHINCLLITCLLLCMRVGWVPVGHIGHDDAAELDDGHLLGPAKWLQDHSRILGGLHMYQPRGIRGGVYFRGVPVSDAAGIHSYSQHVAK